MKQYERMTIQKMTSFRVIAVQWQALKKQEENLLWELFTTEPHLAVTCVYVLFLRNSSCTHFILCHCGKGTRSDLKVVFLKNHSLEALGL